MGTSAPSAGPGSGVPLVPPWVNDPEDSEPMPLDDDQDVIEVPGIDVNGQLEATMQIAPPGRFRGARSNLGRFSSSGSSESMRRGLGQYVQTGLGGSRQASRRMVGTARKAGSLYDVLTALSSGTVPGVELGIDPMLLSGRPAREAIDRIALALSPSDGTQDSEASRNAISQALCELVQREPAAELGALTVEQIELAMELFITEDICRRIELDIGKTVLDKAPEPATAIRRFNEMRRYVQQAVAACFRRRFENPGRLSRQAAIRLASKVIRDTFRIFESYLS